MKAGENKNTNLVIKGKVVKKGFARGSKSEHEAVYIETTEGAFKLKRMGGNPFYDAELEKLVGKEITVTGTMDGYQFIGTDFVVHGS